jgi:class 3 adenylate cyclase
VYQATGQPRLRIALDYGPVEVQPNTHRPATVAGGDAILRVTRVEPHVEPGQIWATDAFRQELAQRPSLWRTTQITGSDGSERINVKKDGRSEPDLWVQLYRLEF